MPAYIHTYIHARLWRQCRSSDIHTWSHTRIDTYIHACIHTYIHTYMPGSGDSAGALHILIKHAGSRKCCKYVCLYVYGTCMYVCVHVHMRIHVLIVWVNRFTCAFFFFLQKDPTGHTYIHTYIHACMHTCIQLRGRILPDRQSKDEHYSKPRQN